MVLFNAVREDSVDFHNGFFEVRFLVMEHVFYFFFRQFPMWFVRIALVFHNGFCRVRFPAMEQVFFHVSSPALLRNATGGGFTNQICKQCKAHHLHVSLFSYIEENKV